MNNSSMSNLKYSDILDALKKLGPPPTRYNLFGHPDAIARIPTQYSGDVVVETATGMPQIHGAPAFTSPHLPRHPKKWEFPADPFVEYEKSDEAWARPVRFGREVDDKSQYIVFAIQDRHPLGGLLKWR